MGDADVARLSSRCRVSLLLIYDTYSVYVSQMCLYPFGECVAVGISSRNTTSKTKLDTGNHNECARCPYELIFYGGYTQRIINYRHYELQ